MKDITVTVFPDNKTGVKAFRYGANVIMVDKHSVWDTDQSLITDSEGYRYMRIIRQDGGEWSVFFEYHKI